MGKTATLALKITGDASGARGALDDTDSKLGGLGSTFGKLAGLAAGAFAVDKIVEFGKASFDAASNLEQMQGSVDAVFGAVGKARVQLGDWSRDAYKTVGLSSAAYDQMASVIGSQLKNAGVPVDQLADKTNNLIKQGADMSAVFGGSAADAVDALSSALRGEMDPIERYGVSLNQAAIDAQATADGAHKVNGAWSAQAKQAAILELITKQTAQTQGQFAAQSGTAAEKAQSLSAWFENLQAKVGNYLLPIFVTLGTFFSEKLAPVISRLVSDTGPLGAIFAQVGDYVTTKLVPAVTDLFNFLAPKLVPIFQEVGHIITDFVVPAFGKIWDFIKTYVIPILKSTLGPALDGVQSAWHSISDAIERNKGKFQEIYDKIKPFLDFLKNTVAPIVGTVLKDGFEVAGKAIGKVVDLITWVLDKAASVVGFIGKVGGFLFGGDSKGGGGAKRGAGVFGAAASPTGARLFGAAGSLGGGSVGPATLAGGSLVQAGDTYVITVQGALDPTAVADQIGRLLDQRARRLGQRPAFGGAV